MLFLSAWFPNRVTPFNGDFIERQAIAVSAFCRVSVVHVVAENRTQGRLFEINEIHQGGLYEVIVYFRKNRCRLRMLAQPVNHFRYISGYLKGYRLVRKNIGKPSVIHANIISPILIPAVFLSTVNGIPYIVSEHWTRFLSDDTGPAFILKLALSKAFAVVTVSRNLQHALREKHGIGSRFYVVPNVVDTRVFIPENDAPVGRMKQLIHVSSMKEDQKNICGIIRAVKRLSNIRNDFRFVFIGDFQTHQVELAETLGLIHHFVLFMGEKTHAEVAVAMKESHGLVLFSNRENLPCVILESLSCGLPVISSDTGGISEWINIENGILVRPGDEDALLNAMDHILNHYKAYNAGNLHRFAVKHFSNEVIAGQLLQIYQEAIHAGNHD